MTYDMYADLPRIAAALLNEPWMIMPAHHQRMVEQLVAHRTGHGVATLSALQVAPARPVKEEEPPEGYVNAICSFDKETRLGMIEINGVMGKGLSMLATLCGGVDMNALHDGLDRLAMLGPVAVELYLSTPGGSVNGTQEAAEAVEEFARTVAPVHGYVDKMCASGGAFLGSGATTLMSGPTAILGSIGVYSACVDRSAAAAMEGEKVHLFSSGPLKGAGYPGVALTAAQLAERQREVDEMAAVFFQQMMIRQPSNRPALQPAVHFSGGHWQAQTAAGSALHDGLVRDRMTHLRHLVSSYASGKRRALR